MHGTPVILQAENIVKRFGALQALGGVSVKLLRGECLGLVGHNGAGKSTLMHVLLGGLTPDEGTLSVAGEVRHDYGTDAAKALGVRCVYQELSLCPNLTVAENARIPHPSIRGWGWRKRAGRLILDKLDEIFPGHGLTANMLVSDLAIGKQQMLEIARAFTVTSDPLRVVILDEPTSSLDAHTAAQLLAFVRKSVAEGISCILISHMLGEILACSDCIVVMRDGTVCATGPASDFDRDKLVLAMGGHEPEPHRDPVAARASSTGAPVPVVVQARAARQRDDLTLIARQGEIVGLAGLAAHGQTDILLSIFDAATGRSGHASVSGRVAFVAGDRRRDGVFPQWSIARNITVRSLGRLTRGGLVSRGLSRAMAQDWRERIGIRTPDMHAPILSLSGGNQQKALFARALASDAQIILMDDPMRGVDVGTKLDVYALLRREAESGRTFLWYTTEMEELEHCDRVYVFRNGMIATELTHDQIDEDSVIRASFREAA